tara:strand:- start:143 stop:493 length:351 start_codon:yes stop_codon:yes gene_type:complete
MNKKEFRDDAFETIRDLMGDGEPKDEIKKQLENTYPDVHPNTFYKWMNIVEKEPEIIHKDDERFFKIQKENEEKSKFKKQLFNDAKKEYLKAKKEDTDPKLIQSLRQECRSWLKPY